MFTLNSSLCSSLFLLYGIMAVPSPVCGTVASQDTSLWNTGTIEVRSFCSFSYACIICYILIYTCWYSAFINFSLLEHGCLKVVPWGSTRKMSGWMDLRIFFMINTYYGQIKSFWWALVIYFNYISRKPWLHLFSEPFDMASNHCCSYILNHLIE